MFSRGTFLLDNSIAIKTLRRSKMSKDHTHYSGDFDGWMMSNPGMVNGYVTINHTDDESI